MKTKTKEKTDKLSTPLIVLAAILAALLVVSMFFSVTNKAKTVYIPVPSDASSNFSGTMLSDYDNLILSVSQDFVTFDFGSVSLADYDFIVLDVLNSTITPNDVHSISYGILFDVDGSELFLENTASVDPSSFQLSSGPYIEEGVSNKTITYVLCLSELEDGNVRWVTYIDGLFHKTGEVNSVSHTSKITGFKLSFPNDSSELYDTYEIGGMYLYGFENADDCTIGDYISNITLKLTNCKDSMLYTGE